MDRQGKLLLVDDEELNRDMLSRRLIRNGFAVETANDGVSALQKIDQAEVDLVLLDSMMPGMNGIDVLRLLRATRSAEDLPVIMVTAVNESDKIAEAINLGANDYVTKPIDFPVTLARIRSQLSRKQAERALRQSEERYALAARGANDGLWDWDLRTNHVYYSPRWESMLGYAAGELRPTQEEWLSRVHPDDRLRLEHALQAHCAGGSDESFEIEHRVLHRDGSYRWMLSRGAAVRDGSGAAVRMAGSQSDITDKKVYDALTGLANRLLFLDRVGRAIERGRQDHSFRFAVLFLDLDRFKIVNDSLGHIAGDHLLLSVTGRLKEVVGGWAREDAGRGEVVARLGGDEFAILLEKVTDAADASQVADRIVDSIKQPYQILGRDVLTSMSIGITLSTPEYSTPDELIRDADLAMYTAKARGKSQWVAFDDPMREQVLARLQLENDLQRALERNEMIIHYQPKVHLDSGRLRGFEALVRWNHPKHGLLGPYHFIPLAEETGQICEIGLWVLREACRQVRQWQLMYAAEPVLEVSVNVSVRQFRQPDLVEQVERTLAETGLAPKTLQLEVTESVLLEDVENAVTILKRLKDLGVGLKVDDFGTGYSCLQYLCRLPFDTLKIDRTFTMAMTETDSKYPEIVKTILAMAHNLGMDVVAEGVERSDQVDLLRELGCEFAQGYFFSRPVSAAEAEALVRDKGAGFVPAAS